MTRFATMRRRPSRAALLLLAAGLIAAGRADAQNAAPAVSDGSEAAIGAETAQAVFALVDKALKDKGAKDPTARYARLRPGRAGALCGEVDSMNRMGAHTGPRGFVADLEAGFGGILPDAPELRHASSPAQFEAMRRTLELYKANCAAE